MAGRRAASWSFGFVVLASLLLGLGAREAQARGGHPHFDDGNTLDWLHDLESAKHRARTEHKFIFVELGKPGCGNCRDLVTRLVPKPGFRERLQRIAVGLAIDARFPEARVQRIFQRWVPASQLRKLPWAGFLDEEGRWITGWGGRIGDEQYDAFLARAEYVFAVAERKRRGLSDDDVALEPHDAAPLAHADTVPPDPEHPMLDDEQRAKRKTLLSTEDGIGICVGGHCGGTSTKARAPTCGPDGCDAPSALLDGPVVFDDQEDELSPDALLADLPGSDAPPELRTWSQGELLGGPLGRTTYVAPVPGDDVAPLRDLGPRPTRAPRPAPDCAVPGRLPPPEVRRVDGWRVHAGEAPAALADAHEPFSAPEVELYGSPDGDQSANKPTAIPVGKPITDAPPTLARVATEPGHVAGEIRAVRMTVEPEPDLDPLAPWAEARILEAFAAAQAGRLDDARISLGAVTSRPGAQAMAEDARRGLDALKDLGEISQMRPSSPIRSYLLGKARDSYRGSRWAELFR